MYVLCNVRTVCVKGIRQVHGDGGSGEASLDCGGLDGGLASQDLQSTSHGKHGSFCVCAWFCVKVCDECEYVCVCVL